MGICYRYVINVWFNAWNIQGNRNSISPGFMWSNDGSKMQSPQLDPFKTLNIFSNIYANTENWLYFSAYFEANLFVCKKREFDWNYPMKISKIS